MEQEAVIGTELGPWRLRWTGRGLCAFRPAPGAARRMPADAPPWILEAAGRLTRHLDGDPQPLGDLPLDLTGLSAFQRAVAEALRGLAPGSVVTYGDLAALAGRPGAARAVGRAVRDNPLLVLIPCHRVVGAKDAGGWSAFRHPAVKARLMDLDRL